MKKLIALITILSINNLAWADCYPTQWKLPNKGKDCKYLSNFGDPQIAMLWSCLNAENTNVLYLMTGKVVVQNEGDICFFIEKTIEQSKNTPVF